MLKFFLKSCAVILLSLSLAQCSWAEVDLDGTDGHILVSNPGNILDGQSLSISVWVDWDDGTDDFERIIGRVYDGQFALFMHEGFDALGIAISASGGDRDTYFASEIGVGTLTINDIIGTKTHLCITYDQTTIRGYKSGSYVDDTFETTSGGLSNSVDNIKIGARVDAGTDRYFDGGISELAVWKSVLTPTEIAQLANSKIKGMPLQIQSTNLVLYWPLDDHPAGTSINTLVFNDLAGTNNGTGVDAGNQSVTVGETVLSYPSGILGGL